MKRYAWLIVGIILCGGLAQAEVTVAKVFGDHMVLQRDIEVPVWGWADPGAKVTIEFAPRLGSGQGGQKKTTKADKAGKWMVRLDPMKASSKGRALVVREQGGADAKSGITFTNVVVGEVWLCSGQSNMSFTMGKGRDVLKEGCATANFPLIRHIAVGGKFSTKKAKDLAGGSAWKVCTPKSVRGFTAVGFFFGRKVHQETDLPVGLIHSSVGGTQIEPWTPAEGFALVPELGRLREQTFGADEGA
jgi:sialate O-acetylesterase